MPTSPPATKLTPIQSTLRAERGLRLSGTYQNVTARTISARGILNEKYPPPGPVLDQKTAEDRPHRGRDRCKPRPCADCRASVLMTKRCTDDCETAGHE